MAEKTLPTSVVKSKSTPKKLPAHNPVRLLSAVDTGAVIQLFAELPAASAGTAVELTALMVTAERVYQNKTWPTYFTVAFEGYRLRDVVASILGSLMFLVDEGWFTYEGGCSYVITYDQDDNPIIAGALAATGLLQEILAQLSKTETV